jgi:aminoglycoside 6'-N-acetyltransferase
VSEFRFRPITRADYPRVSEWLAEPHNARWWCDSAEPQAVEAEYGGVIDGKEPAEVFIVEHHGRDFALVQRFAMDGYPEYVREIGALAPVPEDAWSIDYLIGRQADTGKGHGTRMLQSFVDTIWRDHPQAGCILVPVHAHNRASWRVLERIGFARVAAGELEPDNPIDTREHFLYGLQCRA